eukprot:1218843-Prymnesium_polylepis.1
MQHERPQSQHRLDDALAVRLDRERALEDVDGARAPAVVVVGEWRERGGRAEEVHALEAARHTRPLLEPAPAAARVGVVIARQPRVCVRRVGREHDKVVRGERVEREGLDGEHLEVGVGLRDGGVVDPQEERGRLDPVERAEGGARGEDGGVVLAARVGL